MTIWIISTIVIGVLVIGLSVYSFIPDNKAMTLKQKSGSYLLPNLTLLLFGISWLLLAGYLYLDIQNQISYFQR